MNKMFMNFLLIGIIVTLVMATSCKKDDNNSTSSPSSTIQYGSFTDSRDGKTYKTVKIGNQTWMAENLNYNADSGSWVYDNDTSNAATYGRLYNWATACDVCPDGWHLPTDGEWKTLEMYLGMSQSEANATGFRGTDEGSKLKATSGWNSEGNGTNSSGFTALPGGWFSDNGVFYSIGNLASIWSWTEYDSNSAWFRGLLNSYENVGRSCQYKDQGFSVRCIRD